MATLNQSAPQTESLLKVIEEVAEAKGIDSKACRYAEARCRSESEDSAWRDGHGRNR